MPSTVSRCTSRDTSARRPWRAGGVWASCIPKSSGSARSVGTVGTPSDGLDWTWARRAPVRQKRSYPERVQRRPSRGPPVRRSIVVGGTAHPVEATRRRRCPRTRRSPSVQAPRNHMRQRQPPTMSRAGIPDQHGRTRHPWLVTVGWPCLPDGTTARTVRHPLGAGTEGVPFHGSKTLHRPLGVRQRPPAPGQLHTFSFAAFRGRG
jgi:hypothetical protein